MISRVCFFTMFITAALFLLSTDKSVLSAFLGGYFFWSKDQLKNDEAPDAEINIYAYWAAFVALGFIAYPKIQINIFLCYVLSVLVMGSYILFYQVARANGGDLDE